MLFIMFYQVYQASCLPTTRAQKPEQYKIETPFST
jgi:hypothetical protein